VAYLKVFKCHGWLPVPRIGVLSNVLCTGVNTVGCASHTVSREGSLLLLLEDIIFILNLPTGNGHVI
jgi:hypothetical protein